MYHGRKKQAKEELTPEQRREIETKLDKITLINQTLLRKRASKEYDRASLDQTEKYSMLSPDFATLWNYRREIIAHLFATEESLDRYEFVTRELDFLVKSIMKSPKSYTLWFHRQWVIDLGLKEERLRQKESSKILDNELRLCDKMLMMDERNFHCWNYRLSTALLYLKEIPLREGTQEVAFIEKECAMAEGLIKKNFSNYSAWHYRSKLLPELYKRIGTDGLYEIPFSKIKEDLALLKHAFFTDPKDQSPWNYHEWLISLLSPVQVVSLTQETDEAGRSVLVVGLSQKVRDFGKEVAVRLLKERGESVREVNLVPFKSKRNIASAWAVDVTDVPQGPLSIEIKQKTRALFRDFFVHLDLQKGTFELPSGEVWVRDNTVLDNLVQVLDADTANIKELIEFEKGLRFAVLKVKDLIMTKFEYLANPYYLQAPGLPPMNDVADELSRLTSELAEIDGKSHCGLHDKVLKSFGNVKLRWEKVLESGSLSLFPVNARKFQNEIADRHFGFVGNP